MQTNAAMETKRSGKKKSVGRRIIIALLVLLLLPVILAGALYLYLNLSDFQYDDPQQVIKSTEPMTFSERNSFNPASRTQTMLLNNADIYYLVSDKLPELKYNEKIYINAYRIALKDKAIYLQGKAYGVNIPIKLEIEAGWQNGSVLLRIENAYLGKGNIPIPLKKIAEQVGFDLEYQIDLNSILLFKSAMDLKIEDGYLKIKFPVDKSIVNEGLNAWAYLKPAALYLREYDDMLLLVEDYQKHSSEDEYISEHLDAFIGKFRQNPDAYQELIVKTLAASPENYAQKYFKREGYDADVMARFFPGITPEAVEKMRGQLTYEKNYTFLRDFIFNIDEQFGNRTITAKNGKFVYTKTGKALELSSYYENFPEAKEVFAEGTEYCAVNCVGADSRQKIGKVTYAAGTAIKFASGRCAILCKMQDKFHYTEITPQEYDDLASGKTTFYVAAIRDRG